MFELLFGQRRQNPASTAVAEPEIDRKSELLEEIRSLDVELGDVEAAILSFRTKNLAIVGTRLALMYPAGTDTGVAREQIESRWKILCAEREKIQKRRNDVLRELGKYS